MDEPEPPPQHGAPLYDVSACAPGPLYETPYPALLPDPVLDHSQSFTEFPYAIDDQAVVFGQPSLAPFRTPLSPPGAVQTVEGGRPPSCLRDALVIIPLCRKGDRVAIEAHLASGTGSVEEVDIEGNTPLHVAVEAPKNEIATIQCLLEYGADAQAQNYLGATPLHYVSLRKSNHRGITNILLENGAAIDTQTLAGKSVLHFACEMQIPELVEVICLFGSDVNLVDVEGNTAVHAAVCKPGGRDTVKQQILELLVRNHGVCTAPNSAGWMPTHMCSNNGYVRCLRFLAEQRADMMQMTANGHTCLHLACEKNLMDASQFLLVYQPECVNLMDVNGNTALHLCAINGSLDCAMLLLRNGAVTTARNRSGKTAADLAKIRGTDLNNTHNAELENILKDSQGGGGCKQS